MPLLSLVVENKDLYDEKNGIIENYNERGKEWERFSYVSYFENGRLQFASAVGVRIHGGTTRKLEKKSYRIYCRDEIGMSHFPDNLFQEPKPGPIRSLVIHQDRPTGLPFTTSIAFDIAKKIGCVVPSCKPVKFYLNGEHQGIYWISEHLSKSQWALYFGHVNFSFFRFKAESDRKSLKNYLKLVRWAKQLDPKTPIKVINEIVDVENMTRTLIATIFLGNSDWEQGVAVYNPKSENPSWFWIIWDVDKSFQDHSPARSSREPWEQTGIQLVLREKKTSIDVRRILFRKLILNNSEYLDYFRKTFTDIINHEITPNFIDERCRYYETLAVAFKNEKPFNPMIKEFLIKRPEYLLFDLQRHLNPDDLEMSS